MTRLIIGMLALGMLAFVPTALAVCTAGNNVCVDEYGYTYGTCDNGFSYGVTFINVNSPAGSASAGGQTFCGGYPGVYDYEGGEIFAYASTPAGFVVVDWYGYDQTFFGQDYGYCQTVVGSSATGYQDLGCPAGNPPSLPWGNVLP